MDRRLLKPLSDWTLDDVQALVDERLPEQQRLDYKQELPLDRDGDRAELAKDVSGMANAQGGLIIYGVAEDDSDEPRPTKVTPLPRAGQQTRVEDILDSAVYPQLDYETWTLDAEDGSVLLVRAAPRAGAPHMVQSYKQHRYFIRRGTRTAPMSEDDVRLAYEAVSARADRLLGLLTQLPLLPRIGRTRAIDVLRMTAGGAPAPEEWTPVVSVVAAPLAGPEELISPANLTQTAFPEPFDRYVGDRRARVGGHFTIDAFGLIEELTEEGPREPSAPVLTIARMRIYRQGVLEWAYRYGGHPLGVPDPQAIPSSSFAQDVHNAFAYFASIYDAVGYAGRLAVHVRIDNGEHARLNVNTRLAEPRAPTEAGVEAVNVYRETSVEALLRDPLALTRDVMQHIWQSFGYPRCLLFDEDGKWVLDS